MSSYHKAYSCGAPVAPSLVERFEREVGPYIHNTYGLTETTAPSHAVPHGRRAPVDPSSGALSIGVPLFNNLVRIVDENGDAAMRYRSVSLARSPSADPKSYLVTGADQRRRQGSLPGGEMRTGDIGFMDEQGWFYLVDRKKDLIIAAGYKVWPREVEDVLIEHPAVREAAVIGVPDEYRVRASRRSSVCDLTPRRRRRS